MERTMNFHIYAMTNNKFYDSTVMVLPGEHFNLEGIREELARKAHVPSMEVVIVSFQEIPY